MRRLFTTRDLAAVVTRALLLLEYAAFQVRFPVYMHWAVP
jgi:hypothetical protein